MNAAELKVDLQGLALSAVWFARHMEVSVRTVRRWLEGEAIPDDVGKEVRRLKKIADAAVQDQISAVRAAGAVRGQVVHLQTYRLDSDLYADGYYAPASWHRMIIFRAADALRKKRYSVTIDYR